ncbi:MAG: glycosyltransferase [Nitrospiraceae bacterium]|nr:glycosyltransferase [Nitrospiraceae bacterium]
MSDIAIFTIISKNYISYARTLMDSVAAYQPDADRFLLLADRIDGHFDPAEENFRTVQIEELNIPDRESLFFKYDIMELNTAAKPFFIEHLLARFGYRKVIYFDPDILVMRDLRELCGILDNYSIVLTPHFTKPIPDDGKKFGEIDIMRTGCYNLGFIALSSYDRVKGFLEWWKARLQKYCYSAPEQGLFVDQKWIDLVPSLCEGVFILKHPGYNAAYWNLHERTFATTRDGYRVNCEPLFFYHFSGIVFDNLDVVSKYQNRFTLKEIPQLRPLFNLYKKKVLASGYESTRHWSYAFGFFENGIRIPDIVRRLYGYLEGREDFENPFATSRGKSFFDWLIAPVSSRLVISNVLLYIYEQRTDLQKAFPRLSEEQEALFQWALLNLSSQYGFSDDFLRSLKLETTEPRTAQSPPPAAVQYAKDILWEYGMKHAEAIKSVPVLRGIAEKAFWKLAEEKSSASLPLPLRSAPLSVSACESLNELVGEAGINIAGYLDTESGVGEAARGMVRSLEKSGLGFVLNNIEQEWLRRDDRTYVQFSHDNPYAVNLVHVNADQMPAVFAQLGEDYFKRKYNIGYWFWELSYFPEKWLGSFEYFNEIWVASDFLLDAISRVSPIPVVKVPISVEFSPPGILTRKALGVREDAFMFLNIFDCRSFIERKNPLALLDAFRIAYRNPDCRNSVLVLKMTNTETNPQLLETLRKKSAGLPVVMIGEYYDRAHVNDLFALCDCYVSLHRSEGLGLPLAEAMYLGKPVIATGYSGNMEFMNVNNSYLVKYELVEIENEIGPYEKGALWADPHPEHAAELMQFVYENRESSRKTGLKAAADIKDYYSPSTLCTKIRSRLRTFR